MTDLHNISHLFLTATPRPAAAPAATDSCEIPAAILVVGFAGPAALHGFGDGLAAALNALGRPTVFASPGPDPSTGLPPARFADSAPAIILLLYHADDGNPPPPCAAAADRVILLITPRCDPQRIGRFAETAANANAGTGISLCVTNADCAEARDIAARLRSATSVPIGFLGQVPSCAAPRRTVLGGRTVNLARQPEMAAIEQAFHTIAANLAASLDRTPASDRPASRQLQQLLVERAPELFASRR